MIALVLAVLGSVVAFPKSGTAADFMVYGVYRPLDLGDSAEPPARDYYINMGSAQGLTDGATVQVMRKMATYDLEAQKLYQDLTFPIATLKVIHVEPNAAVARLIKMTPVEETPSFAPRSIMVGDLVQRR
jgi:hypothetical protein